MECHDIIKKITHTQHATVNNDFELTKVWNAMILLKNNPQTCKCKQIRLRSAAGGDSETNADNKKADMGPVTTHAGRHNTRVLLCKQFVLQLLLGILQER